MAGHVLTVIDENQKKITEDVGIWFNGTFYKVRECRKSKNIRKVQRV